MPSGSHNLGNHSPVHAAREVQRPHTVRAPRARGHRPANLTAGCAQTPPRERPDPARTASNRLGRNAGTADAPGGLRERSLRTVRWPPCHDTPAGAVCIPSRSCRDVKEEAPDTRTPSPASCFTPSQRYTFHILSQDESPCPAPTHNVISTTDASVQRQIYNCSYANPKS